MERKPFRHPDLLPVQLRLDGLCGRIAHVERTLAIIPGGLAEDMRRQLEHAAYFRGLNDLQRAFEGIARSLYGRGFLDQLKVIRSGKIVPLRDLVERP